MSGLRLALAGGGTGGHVAPGLHLLANARPGELADLVWFSSGRSVEQAFFSAPPAVPGADFERVILNLEPSGGGAPRSRDLALRTPRAAITCRSTLRRHGTDVLLGLGGFTSLPAVLAARSLGIPVALLEVNAVSGRATRWLGRMATRVFHTWAPDPASARDVQTGPPLPPDFPRAARSAQGQRPQLLVLGGSQGAGALNHFLRTSDARLAQAGIDVVHQVGPGRASEAAAPRAGYEAHEFLNDVPERLTTATLVLCRGGASTLAEVAAARVPAWVVPYPHHPDQHQRRNAERLGDGVRIVDESDLNGALVPLIECLGPARAALRAGMSAALERAVPSDGARRILSELRALVR